MHNLAMLIQATPDLTKIQDALNSPSVGLEEFWSMIAINYMCTIGVQWAKWTNVKLMNWISAETPWITRAVVACLSAATAVGIHKTWEPTTGALLITGLTGPNIFHMGKHILVNYAMQHGWWKLLFSRIEDVKRALPAPVIPSANP